jgi:beta-xylosidase
MTTATNPAGPWAPLTQILSSSGWDDCCSFWDDDGQEYLIGTNYANNYTTWIYPVTNNGTNLVTTSGTIVRTGTGGEANKLYKINGTYYHLFSATNGGARVVYMQSASNVMGPYGAAKQVTEGNLSANQPNQGGLVQAVNGNWYFYTRHRRMGGAGR